MKYFTLLTFMISIMTFNIALAIGINPIGRTKRPNVFLFMGPMDFYNSMDTRTVTFKNSGRLKTQTITTSLPVGPFSIDSDGCAGTELTPGSTCDITIIYFHPGSYPQSETLMISAPGFSAEARLFSCNPMFC